MSGSNLNKNLTKKQIFFYGLFLFIADLFFLGFSGFLAYFVRFYTKIFKTIEFSFTINIQYIIFSFIFIAIILVIFLCFKLYNFKNIYSKPTHFLKIILSLIIATTIFIILWLSVNNFLFSRIWLLLFFLFATLFLIIYRSFISLFIKYKLRNYGFPLKNYYFGFGENLKILKNMSRSKRKIIFGLFLVINDVLFFAFSFYYSYYLRFFTTIFHENELSFTLNNNYLLFSYIFIGTAILIFFTSKLYNWDNIYRGSGYFYRIARAIFINIVLIILIGSLFNRFTFSRIWLLLLLILCLLTVAGSRILIELITQIIINKLKISSKTVILGIGENGKRIEDTFNRRSFWGYNIVGYIDKKNRIESDKKYSSNFKILGHTENIKEILSSNNIQRVIISGLEYNYSESLEIIEKLKGMDVSIMLFPGFFEFSVKRLAVREISGIPLMQVDNIGFFGINLFLKNLLDYFLGFIIFLFFIPIYLIVSVVIKIDSPGPVFYKQKRYTKNCREFYIYKFRTMFVDADKRIEELKHLNEADGPLFKIKNDPRITNAGRLLRKFSIDELPQIINVLRGELSLVGPRPPLPSEVEKYSDWEMKRLDVKQGITGLWQISGRSELNFEEMTRLDLYYIQNWSIAMDIIIILKTIPTILFSKGAY